MRYMVCLNKFLCTSYRAGPLACVFSIIIIGGCAPLLGVDRRSDAHALYIQGVRAKLNNDNNAALTYWKRSHGVDPTYHKPVSGLAGIYSNVLPVSNSSANNQIGNLKDCLHYSEMLERYEDGYATGIYLQGLCNDAVGEPQSAIFHYERLIKISPQKKYITYESEPKRIRVYMSLAYLYGRVRDLQSALKYFKLYKDNYSESVGPHQDLLDAEYFIGCIGRLQELASKRKGTSQNHAHNTAGTTSEQKRDSYAPNDRVPKPMQTSASRNVNTDARSTRVVQSSSAKPNHNIVGDSIDDEDALRKKIYADLDVRFNRAIVRRSLRSSF